MRCHLAGETREGQHCFDDSGREYRGIQGALVFGHGNVFVDDGICLDDVVSPLVVVCMLKLINFLPEKSLKRNFNEFSNLKT